MLKLAALAPKNKEFLKELAVSAAEKCSKTPQKTQLTCSSKKLIHGVNWAAVFWEEENAAVLLSKEGKTIDQFLLGPHLLQA